MMAEVAGHFGEWIQGRLGPDGPLALVTVACPALSVRAVREDGDLTGLRVDVALADHRRSAAGRRA